MAHYATKLQDAIAAHRDEKAEALERATELLAYLSSPKFRCGSELDGYVNVADVQARLMPIITPLFPNCADER